MNHSALDVWVDDMLAAKISNEAELGFALFYTEEWLKHPQAYPFSPHLPLDKRSVGAEVKNFFSNLLPEGSALEVAASQHNLSKFDAFGLLSRLGREVAGALAITREGETLNPQVNLRLVSSEELRHRINHRDYIQFSLWDGKIRLSIAGYQDKLAVFLLA